MTEYTGRAVLLKVGDGAGTDTFTTLGNILSTSITVNNEEVDVSNATNGVWKKLLEGAGNRSATVSGNGHFGNDTGVADMEDFTHSGSIESFQMNFGNGDVWDFEALVTSFSRAGDHNGAETFDYSLTISGAISITSG